MKVLFLASGNNNKGLVDNLINAQGLSLIKMGVDLEFFAVNGRGISGYWSSAMQLRKYLKKNKIDIIHSHFGWCSLVALIARRKEKIVASFMGDDLLGSYKNGFYTFKSKQTVKINKIFAKYFYDFNIVKSKNLQNVLSNLKNVSVIPNGVNYEIFFPMDKINARNQLGLGIEKKIVLFAANPERPEKNFPLCKEVIEKMGRKDIELLVVYGVSQQTLNLYYNSADVIFLTSVHEGSPNVIKEALVSNRPIVATNVGDVKDHLINIDGCYVTNYDVNEIIFSIEKALTKGSINARGKLDYLKSENVAIKIINIYKLLLI